MKSFLSSIKLGAINWKTTACGLGSIFTALGDFLSSQYDTDPTTTPNWMMISTLVLAGLGLIFAKDATKPVE